MTLLQQIQNDVIDGSTDVATTLRKCRILAQRLKNDEFKQWVNSELDGYSSSAALPDYRKTSCQSLGHFSGHFGRSLQNAPIPMTLIPKEFHDYLAKAFFLDGVSSLQELLQGNDSGILHENWPAELYPVVGGQIYEHMNLMSAYKVIPKSTIAGVLDTVRNKILNFVLEIESQNPDAGEAVPTNTPVSSDKVQQIFHTHITGDVGNIATGSHSFNQSAVFQIAKGDFAALEKTVRSIGGLEEDIEGLKVAVKTEPNAPEGKLGNSTSAWLGRMVTKSAQGALKVGTSVAVDVLTSALKQYYGY